VSITKRPLGINQNYYNEYMKVEGAEYEWKDDQSFFIPMNSKNDEGKMENNGFVRV